MVCEPNITNTYRRKWLIRMRFPIIIFVRSVQLIILYVRIHNCFRNSWWKWASLISCVFFLIKINCYIGIFWGWQLFSILHEIWYLYRLKMTSWTSLKYNFHWLKMNKFLLYAHMNLIHHSNIIYWLKGLTT